jgi:hypothetical protein
MSSWLAYFNSSFLGPVTLGLVPGTCPSWILISLPQDMLDRARPFPLRWVAQEAIPMSSEAIPVRGREFIVVEASPGVAVTIEEACADRVTIRVAPRSEPDSTSQSDLLAAGVAPAVVTLAHRLGILEPLTTAFQIARDCFRTGCQWSLIAHEELGQIEINVMVAGTVEEVYRQHTACVDRWVKLLPADAVGKIALTEDFA